MHQAFRTNLIRLTCLVLLGFFATVAPAADYQYGADEFVIYAGGNVSMRERTTFTGNIGAGGYLSIREDATYSGGNLFANGWVSVGRRTTVTGLILSGGNFDIYDDADIGGDIQADGRITVYTRAHARSDLYATGSISVNQNATVDGSVNQSSTLPHSWTTPNVAKPTFSPGSSDFSLSSNQTGALAPGQYKVIRLRAGSTIQLSAGSYHFGAIQIGQDVTFEIDDSDGPVHVYVDNKFSARERSEFTVQSGAASGFTLWATKNVSLREQCQFTGNIRCFANVSLRENTQFTGTIYATGYFSGRENSTFKSSSPPPVFYVRTRGSDANDGLTPRTPFRTVQKAVNNCTLPGSTIYVGPGTYTESVAIGTGVGTDAVSGTESKPIRLIADVTGANTNDDPGEVLIDGRTTSVSAITITGRDHWIFQGFTFRNQKTNGIYATNAGMRVLDCTFKVPASYAIYATASGDITIADCIFERASSSGHMMWVMPNNRTTATSVLITRNDATLKGDLYMSTKLERGWQSIQRRSWATRYTYGIVVIGSGRPMVDRVEISNNQFSDCYLSIYSGVYSNMAMTSVIANNTVTGSFYAIYSYAYNSQSTSVINNIIDTSYYGLMSYSNRGQTPVVAALIENNITYSMARYNRSFEFDIINAAPLYTDAPAGDLSLQSGSPGIDAGVLANAPSTDISGRSRPTDGNNDGLAQIDIGAYELVNERTKIKMVQWREISGHRDMSGN